MTIDNWITICIAGGTALGAGVVTFVSYVIRHNNSQDKIIASNKANVDFLKTLFETTLPPLLVRPTHKTMDELLSYFEKQRTDELSEDELRELLTQLNKAYGKNGDAVRSETDKLAAMLLTWPIVTRIKDFEREREKGEKCYKRFFGRFFPTL